MDFKTNGFLALLTLVASLSMVSCEMEPVYLTPYDIAFDADMKQTSENFYERISGTKSSGSENAPFSSFQVASFKTGSATAYFDAETVVWQESGNYVGSFISKIVHPWPKREALDFFAWKGEGAGKITNNYGTVSLSYTSPASEDGLLFVGMEKNCANTRLRVLENKSQTIEFEEALTMVEKVTLTAISMNPVPDSELFMYVVNDFKIKDINRDGVYTFNPTSKVSNWSLGGNLADHVFAGSGVPEIIFNGAGSSVVSDDSFTMIPQSVCFSISFDVYNSSDGGVSWSKTYSDIAGSATVNLALGKSYDINFIFGASKVYGSVFKISAKEVEE